MNKKFLIAWVVVFIVWFFGSFAVHGVLLRSDYMQLTNLKIGQLHIVGTQQHPVHGKAAEEPDYEDNDPGNEEFLIHDSSPLISWRGAKRDCILPEACESTAMLGRAPPGGSAACDRE